MHAIDSALELALVVMRNGGSTKMVDQAFRNVAKGLRLDPVSTAWRLDHLAAGAAIDGRPATSLRSVGAIGVNLGRVSEAMLLSERVAREEITAPVLASEMERIRTMPSSFDRWMFVPAAACAAGAFSQVNGGDWGALGVAFAAAAPGQFLRLWLQDRQHPVRRVTLICGLLSACLAGLGLRLGLSQSGPVTMIASVSYLAPGLPLINAFLDVTSHQHLFIGLERVANAAFLFFLLALDIAFACVVVLRT